MHLRRIDDYKIPRDAFRYTPDMFSKEERINQIPAWAHQQGIKMCRVEIAPGLIHLNCDELVSEPLVYRVKKMLENDTFQDYMRGRKYLTPYEVLQRSPQEVKCYFKSKAVGEPSKINNCPDDIGLSG